MSRTSNQIVGGQLESQPKPANVAMNLLRFGCALLVVLEHGRILFFVDWDIAPHNPLQLVLYGITALGHPAVIVFFVLSGYWVGGGALLKAQSRNFSWRSFLQNRLVRLWVVIIPALILTALLDFVGQTFFGEMSTYTGNPDYQGVAINHPDSSLYSFLGTLFFLGAIKTPTFGTDVALWSISYEFWMYVFGALLISFFYAKAKAKIANTLIFLVLIVALGPGVMNYFPIWLLGLLVAINKQTIEHLLHKMRKTPLRAIRLFLMFLLLGVSLFIRSNDGLSPIVGDLLIAFTASLLIASVTSYEPETGIVGRIIRWLSKMADFSFTMYAIHVPFLVLLASVLGVDIYSRWNPNFLNWGILAIITLGICLISWLISIPTEKQTDKIRRFINKKSQ